MEQGEFRSIRKGDIPIGTKFVYFKTLFFQDENLFKSLSQIANRNHSPHWPLIPSQVIKYHLIQESLYTIYTEGDQE